MKKIFSVYHTSPEIVLARKKIWQFLCAHCQLPIIELSCECVKFFPFLALCHIHAVLNVSVVSQFRVVRKFCRFGFFFFLKCVLCAFSAL